MNIVDKTFNAYLKVRAGPSGLHFFNRSTGINILMDEIQLPANKWSNAPRQVSVALTNICDLKCPHCYAPKNSAMIEFEKLTTWLTELDENGCVGVGFGGGEPTLYPQFIELCSYVSNKTNLAVTMTTHGHRLDDKLLNSLDGNIHFVRVSMDGIGSTYEAIRNRSFDVLINRISALSEITPFGINFLVNSKTIDELDDAIQIASNLGASEFLLLPEAPVGKGNGIDNESSRLLIEWVNEYKGSVPLSISEGSSDGLPTCNPFETETGIAAFAHIDALGIMKKTSYDLSGINISDDGVIDAINKLKLLSIR